MTTPPPPNDVAATIDWTGALPEGPGQFEAALYWMHDPMDLRLIPSSTREGLVRYRNLRTEIGGFLRAVLENNLTEACARADQHNLRALPAIVAWCYHQLPSLSWGSPNKVAAWLRREDERTLTDTEESED